ncbi:MAG: hypothetical protein KIS90_04820 [Phenylobacterium sp.]|nr:hypothetical protein [Phenylobacterium sp.]
MGLKGAVMFVAVAATSGCIEPAPRDTHQYRYPSPDRRVAVVVTPDGRQRAAPGRRNDVYLEGERLATEGPGYAPNDRIRLGSFEGLWSPGAIAWIDETTVNVCPLEGRPAVPKRINVLGQGERRTYLVTTDCPDLLRRAGS